MIVNLRRKVGIATGHQTPITRDGHAHTHDSNNTDTAMHTNGETSTSTSSSAENTGTGMMSGNNGQGNGNGNGYEPLPPMTIEDLDFSWPSDMMFSPTSIPAWLQETVRVPLLSSFFFGQG